MFPPDLPKFKISSTPWWLQPILWLGSQFYPIPLSKSAFIKHYVYNDSIERFFTLRNGLIATSSKSEFHEDTWIERSFDEGVNSLDRARNAQLKVLTLTINEFLENNSQEDQVVILGRGQNIHATCYYLSSALGYHAVSSEWIKEPAAT